jgi:hypothetical protein
MPEKIILENDNTFVYYVDIEKGVVAAVMERPIEEAMGYINRIGEELGKCDIRMPAAGEIIEKNLYSPIRAKATCHEEDDFDLEYGMELARKRCLAKYYKKVTQMFVDFNNLFDPLLCFIEDNIIRCASKYEKFEKFSN